MEYFYVGLVVLLKIIWMNKSNEMFVVIEYNLE